MTIFTAVSLCVLMLVLYLAKRIDRPPHFVIRRNVDDGVYMNRWYVIPRNRWFNIYLHNTLLDDFDESLHDHPWWNISVVLWGGFWEVMPRYRPLYPDLALDVMQGVEPFRRVWRRPGSIVFRRATDAHRLELDRIVRPAFREEVKPSWSLFITGPRKRTWGFWKKDGWVPYTDVVDHGESSSIHKTRAPAP